MIEPEIVAALQGLLPLKVFPDTVPANTTRPFLIYQQVGGQPSYTMCGNTDRQNARVQFVVWCERDTVDGGRTQASTLMRSIESILTETPLYGVSQGSLVALYDEATRTYGARQDFSFWF